MHLNVLLEKIIIEEEMIETNEEKTKEISLRYVFIPKKVVTHLKMRKVMIQMMKHYLWL